MEILKFDSGIDELVQRRSSLNQMNEHAVAHGFVPLYMDGLRRVREGLTTLDEVRRVVEVTVMSV